ncbi:hypothetical protein SNE40_019422 [Patella caerulea]|uniref:Uncharacterized protein n=1 Tax=Patella caerulea TaxID=87958 RepID=A0AAN8J868_PATCE
MLFSSASFDFSTLRSSLNAIGELNTFFVVSGFCLAFELLNFKVRGWCLLFRDIYFTMQFRTSCDWFTGFHYCRSTVVHGEDERHSFFKPDISLMRMALIGVVCRDKAMGEVSFTVIGLWSFVWIVGWI